jgi:uncharacterized protein
MDDGLYQPLGQSRPAARKGGWSAKLIPVVLTAIGAVSLGTWLLLHGSGRPGTERVTAPAAAPTPPPTAAQPQPSPPPTSPAVASPPTAAPVSALSSVEAEQQSGVKVVRPSGATAAPGTFLSIPDADTVALAPAPDPRLVEKGPYGLLPRRGADGARPASVYGRSVAADPSVGADAPRIALFVGGMGLNRNLTAEAAQALPPAVTLGFAPYGTDLEQQVARARALGHEALLQIPMESFDVGDGATMPHMLSIADSSRQTLDNLHWQMSRFAGYAGVSSFLGGKFTGDATAFKPVLKDIADRGLFFLDDGTAPRNLAGSLAPDVALPTVRADVVIDALADPAKVDAALKRLLATARAKGVAVGSTAGLPTVVDRLAAFTRELPSQGAVLVPLSALAQIKTASSGP